MQVRPPEGAHVVPVDLDSLQIGEGGDPLRECSEVVAADVQRLEVGERTQGRHGGDAGD